MRINILFSLLAATVLFVGCRSTRGVSSATAPATYHQWAELVQHNEPSFTTLEASKIAVGVGIGGKKTDVTATVKMHTDSFIVVSIIPFLGIEMFTIELYPDRWILFDRVNRMYYTEKYDYFYYKWGVQVDFQLVQSFISFRLFSATVQGTDAHEWTYTPLPTGGSRIERHQGAVTRCLTTSPSHVVERVEWTDREISTALTAICSDHTISQGINYPSNLSLALQADDMPQLSVEIKLRKVSFNTPISFTPTDTGRYKQGSPGQLKLF